MRMEMQQGHLGKAELGLCLDTACAVALLTAGWLQGTCKLRVHSGGGPSQQELYIPDWLGSFPWEINVNYESDHTPKGIGESPECLASFFPPEITKICLINVKNNNVL